MVFSSGGPGPHARGAGGIVVRGLGRAAALVRDIAAFCFPRSCVVCDATLGDTERGPACTVCWARVRGLPDPRCARCGYPRLVDRCAWCRLLPEFVATVRSAAWMDRGSAADLLHAFKYERWTGLAVPLGERMARLWSPADRPNVVLVPVPLSASRARERGFNQSALLAGVVASHWQCPVQELLSRVRNTKSQTELTRSERLANVGNAFAVASGVGVRGRDVVLVDDVVTTAATLNACADVLQDAGVGRIHYLTFGRARRPFDRVTPDLR